MKPRRRQAFTRTEHGSTTVEVAVLLPLMMLLLMVIVQTGIWFHTRAVMTTAANKGLDAARVDDGTNADGRQATEDFLSHAGALRDHTVNVQRHGDTASVTVSGGVLSLLFGAPLEVTVTVEAPIEQVSP